MFETTNQPQDFLLGWCVLHPKSLTTRDHNPGTIPTGARTDCGATVYLRGRCRKQHQMGSDVGNERVIVSNG